MQSSTPINLSWPRMTVNAIAVFCTKHPLLTLATAVTIIFLGCIRVMHNQDRQNAKSCETSIKLGDLRGAKKSAKKIYSTSTRDAFYEKISLAYNKKMEKAKALEMINKISSQSVKARLLKKIQLV